MLIESWLIGAIKDLTELCLKHHSGDVISLDATVSVKDLPEDYPFKKYVSQRLVSSITSDIVKTISLLEGKKKGNNDLIEAFADFLIDEAAVYLDHPKEKWSYGSTHLGKAMKSFNQMTYHRSARLVANFLTHYNLAPVKYIQSPSELSVEERTEVRIKNPGIFFVFLTDQALLGGIRLSAAGKIIDNSWLGRVQRFAQQAKS